MLYTCGKGARPNFSQKTFNKLICSDIGFLKIYLKTKRLIIAKNKLNITKTLFLSAFSIILM
jgi:hypothetical protein